MVNDTAWRWCMLSAKPLPMRKEPVDRFLDGRPPSQKIQSSNG